MTGLNGNYRKGGTEMKLENLETARELISQRITLEDVIEKAESWKNGHFEFTEHCGSHPDRISITYFPELEEKMLVLIKEEIERIEKDLEKL